MSFEDICDRLKVVMKDYFVENIKIVDNLTTDDSAKVLSARQGKILNDMHSNDLYEIKYLESILDEFMEPYISLTSNKLYVDDNSVKITANLKDKNSTGIPIREVTLTDSNNSTYSLTTGSNGIAQQTFSSVTDNMDFSVNYKDVKDNCSVYYAYLVDNFDGEELNTENWSNTGIESVSFDSTENCLKFENTNSTGYIISSQNKLFHDGFCIEFDVKVDNANNLAIGIRSVDKSLSNHRSNLYGVVNNEWNHVKITKVGNYLKVECNDTIYEEIIENSDSLISFYNDVPNTFYLKNFVSYKQTVKLADSMSSETLSNKWTNSNIESVSLDTTENCLKFTNGTDSGFLQSRYDRIFSNDFCVRFDIKVNNVNVFQMGFRNGSGESLLTHRGDVYGLVGNEWASVKITKVGNYIKSECNDVVLEETILDNQDYRIRFNCESPCTFRLKNFVSYRQKVNMISSFSSTRLDSGNWQNTRIENVSFDSTENCLKFDNTETDGYILTRNTKYFYDNFCIIFDVKTSNVNNLSIGIRTSNNSNLVNHTINAIGCVNNEWNRVKITKVGSNIKFECNGAVLEETITNNIAYRFRFNNNIPNTFFVKNYISYQL